MKLAIRPLSPADVKSRLEPLLKPGETVLWCGQPGGLGIGWRVHSRAIALVGLTAFFCTAVLHGGSGDRLHEYAIMMTFLVLCGAFYAAFIGLLVFVRERTVYGLTADAAIIYRSFPLNKLELFDLASLNRMQLELHNNDIGTVNLGCEPKAPGKRSPAFENVRHARHVFDVAREARLRRFLVVDANSESPNSY